MVRYEPVPVDWVPVGLVTSRPVATGTGAYLVPMTENVVSSRTIVQLLLEPCLSNIRFSKCTISRTKLSIASITATYAHPSVRNSIDTDKNPQENETGR
jgi:hypothetical protein